MEQKETIKINAIWCTALIEPTTKSPILPYTVLASIPPQYSIDEESWYQSIEDPSMMIILKRYCSGYDEEIKEGASICKIPAYTRGLGDNLMNERIQKETIWEKVEQKQVRHVII